MDHHNCCVIYCDDRVRTERLVKKESVATSAVSQKSSQPGYFDLLEEPYELQCNVKAILGVFNSVYLCASGRSFSIKLAEYNDTLGSDCTPILALFDVHIDAKGDQIKLIPIRNFAPHEATTPISPLGGLRRELTFSSEEDESYGLQLLSRISSDIQVQEGPSVIIPVALLRTTESASGNGHTRGPSISSAFYQASESGSTIADDKAVAIDSKKMLKCLDAGAIDVLPSPLEKVRVMGLTVHAYRVYKNASKEQSRFLTTKRHRKQSWVGVDDHKPYAYLREAMVSKLMKGICNPEDVIEDYQDREIIIQEDRKPMIKEAVGTWSFCGHDFTDDELVYAASCMLDHALQMDELDKWRMSADDILKFMQASRAAYNSFVLYHNFRHAVDVLQSLFYFLITIGILPPYPLEPGTKPAQTPRSPVAELLKPFEALTLLISAIGHDVGHPGVNNMFLVQLNAPLAQLYNDKSVLEAFHCAAYSQILRRHWPAAFEDKGLRKLMISSILATDMGIHYDYMHQLGNLQAKIHESKTTESWAPKDIEMFKELACGLLIKCADISNVARPWAVAERWTMILQDEFSHQGEMEKEVGMETTLFGGPPEIGNVLKLANGQMGFMTIYAHPLFDAVADVMPAMAFAPAEILANKVVWAQRAEKEKRKQLLRSETGAVSPRSQSPATPNRKPQETFQQSELPSTAEHPAHHSSPLKASETANFRESRRSSLGNISRLVTPSGASHSQSRRSSLGSPFGVGQTSATTSPDMTSRRSSGAFPGANPQPPPLLARRSSNTVPHSQLQLSGDDDEGAASSPSTRGGSGENEPPRGWESEAGTPTRAAVVASSPNRQSESEGGTETSSTERSPSKRGTTRFANSHKHHHHQQNSSGRFSNFSIYDRNSMATSGARTHSTVLTPVSPSTQATSFLSDGSDEKDNGEGSSRPTSAGMPALLGSENSNHKNNIRASIAGHGNVDASRTVPRRRSKLRLGSALAFWRKKSGDSES